jgi:6-pyruvoyltetrahydropterin/6-carboxytetrahydropterin synthase
MHAEGIIQLRILPATGCERFAEYLYHTINDFLAVETNGRVKATKIEVYEHERKLSKLWRNSYYTTTTTFW